MRARASRPTPAAPAIVLDPILYPCDFSAASTSALGPAVPLARAFGAEIVGLHVVPTRLPPAGGFLSLANPALLLPHLRVDFCRALHGALQPARASGVLTRVEVREGNPAAEILKMADAMNAGLIVMGTHGRGALDRAVMGSVAETVLREATAPVLAVPPAYRAVAHWPRTVLWATDLSAGAGVALRHAVSIAEKAGAELVALHVAEAEDPPHGSVAGSEEERLRGAVALAGGGRCGTDTVVVRGNAADEILRLAGDRAVDLIVVGGSGTGALARLLVGSTARAVVRGARCPVLVVRR